MRVVINADDFGASEAVNRAVIDAFRRGVLTSCSLMASGEAFEDAVRQAREHPGLGIGLHLVAARGRSVLSHRDIPSLVDRSGQFPNDPTRAGLRYFFCRAARRELRLEFTAQFERALAAGVSLSHIDSHLHLHVHPVIFKLAVELGNQYGVRRMRIPEDDPALARKFFGSLPRGRTVEAGIFRTLTRGMKARLRAERFAFTDRVYGHLMTGRMSEAYVLFLLDRLQAPTSEIYCHPALYGDRVSLDAPQKQGRREYDALVSRCVSDRLKILGFERIRYSDLTA